MTTQIRRIHTVVFAGLLTVALPLVARAQAPASAAPTSFDAGVDDGYTVTLPGGATVTVSRRQARQLREQLGL